MHYHWGQTAPKKKKKRKKKETWPFKKRNTHQVKKQCTLSRCSAGRFTQLLLNLVNLRDLFGVGTKLKKGYSRTTTKWIPHLQPEHGFCQQNGSEHCQVQDWYSNDKMVGVPVCLKGRCSFSGCVGLVLY